MAEKTAIQHQAAQDASRAFALIGHSGTLGTADTTGTAEVVRVGANPLTGALYVQDLAGASGTTTVQMVSGTLNAGTVVVSSSSGGTNVNINTGTINVGTFVLPTGTITTGSLSNVAMLNAGTVVMPTGTLTTGSLTNLASLHTGTITTGSLTNLANLVNGSVNVLTGSIQSSGTTTGVGVVSNLTNGSVNILTGTITSLSNLAAGTVQINPDPVPTMLPFGTQGTAGGSFFATISAASGAGTKHFVSHIDIVVESGTADVRVLAGSAIQGTGVLAAGKFTPGGGIHDDFNPAFETGTNSELIYHFVGAGTAFIKAYYWRGV